MLLWPHTVHWEGIYVSLKKFCSWLTLFRTAFRPIPAEKKPTFLYDQTLAGIAKKHNKTVPQVVFRYLVSIKKCTAHTQKTSCQSNLKILTHLSVGHWVYTDTEISSKGAHRRKYQRFWFHTDRWRNQGYRCFQHWRTCASLCRGTIIEIFSIRYWVLKHF